MSAEAVLRFVAVVELHFPRPKFNDDEQMEAAWLASMTRTLGNYPDDVLSEAAQRILRDRNPKKDGRFFPVPSECEDACKAALRLKRAQETPLLGFGPEMSYSERCNLARDLMKAPLGDKAKKEGWSQALWDFCVQHRKLPSGHEIDACKAADAKFMAEREACLRGEREHGKSWAAVAEGMVRKARELMESST